MQITSVTLENIKSYRRAVIHFTPGTTAIRGHNGAGKSTLVEAIGYALFDFLPYSPAARFIREGEKVGKVVVAFVSALDERLYEVERRCVVSGAAAWFVVDPELRQKVVEGKEDTLAFLRLHLGVQTTLPLPDLFDNALAVQQGTFTADFLQTAAVRRKKFDALLQVEEYRQAADNLRDTVSHLKDALASHDRVIADLTARTAHLEGWQQQRADLAAERVAMLEQIEQCTIAREAVSTRLTEAHRQRDELAELRQRREAAHAAWELAAAHHQQAEAEVARASEAQHRCEATAADYARHQEVQTDLARAQADARTLGQLQLARTKAEHDLHQQSAASARTREQWHHARQAIEAITSLTPQVQRQNELEARLATAREAQNALTKLRADLASTKREQASAQREGDETEALIADLLARQPLADQLAERTQRVQQLQALLATQAERQKRHAALRDQLKRQHAIVARAAEALRVAEGHWHRAQAASAASADLAEREIVLANLTGDINRLHVEIDHTETSLHAAENGHCPFLHEPCKNLTQRGIRGLDVYFGDQLTTLGGKLHPLEQQHTVLADEVATLRVRASEATRLDEYAERLALARAAHTEQEAELARLMDEQATLDDPEQSSTTLAHELRAAEQARDESTAADRACARLPEVRKRQEASATRLAQLAQQFAALTTEITTADALATTLATINDALRQLGNPREQMAVATKEAQALPQLEQELATLAAQEAAAQEALASAEAHLLPFAGLDGRIAALQTALAATKAAHDDYLRHEAEAQQLAPRRQRATSTAAAARAAAAAHEAASQRYDASAAAFDVTELERLDGEMHRLDAEVATLRERSRGHKETIDALNRQIAEAQGWVTELAAAQAARAETETTFSLLHYCRDTIKEAGPFVMRALLREISATANRIFGEIMGDRSATLTWAEDYDVIIRTGAYERHFAQLSGGEQMSAALAVRLALLKTLTRATIAFFDEPTQNMDDERRANLATQIRRVTGFEQLLVISHDDTFEEGLDAVIRVHKDGGESLVESDPAAMLPTPIMPFPTTLSA